MLITRKHKVILAMLVVVIGGTASVPYPKNDYKNLRVLPKDISTKALSRIMIDEFNDGLGVSCGFCHAEEKDSHRLDYASDAKPEKEIARQMLKMTLKINKKYFRVTHPLLGDSTIVITCMTCHQGRPRPGDSE